VNKKQKAPRQPDTPRKAAWKILLQWEEGRDAVEPIREGVLRKLRMDRRDSGLVTELTQGTLRHLLFIDHTLKSHLDRPDRALPGPVFMAMRIGAYQLIYLHNIPAHAAVDQSVQLVKGSRYKGFAPLVNAVLRKVADKGSAAAPVFEDDPIGHMELATSTPRWLVEKLATQEGAGEARNILQAMNRTPPLTLRVNTLRTTREKLVAEFDEAGIAVTPGGLSPFAIKVEDRMPPTELVPFGAGMCTVQDEGAQLIAPLLDPQPGHIVLDACAAPGGKTGHLTQLLAGKGKVVAADRGAGRVRLIVETVRRMRLPAVSIVIADLSEKGIPFSKGCFDRVLLDAPCSGTGVLMRHPEGKWKKDPDTIREMTKVQGDLLEAAVARLKTGGRLLYTTCSLLNEENEEVVDKYLAEHNDVRLMDMRELFPAMPQEIFTNRGELRLWPHVHRCDGFYAALLEKQP
jgi:16S rRNA (cytosine967-C5)-methyltransferase